MKKTIVVTFFILIFTLFMTVLAVLYIVEDTIDVSVFFDANEKENIEKDSNKTLELIVLETRNLTDILIFYKSNKKVSHLVKKYTSFNLKYFSPPPEFT